MRLVQEQLWTCGVAPPSHKQTKNSKNHCAMPKHSKFLGLMLLLLAATTSPILENNLSDGTADVPHIPGRPKYITWAISTVSQLQRTEYQYCMGKYRYQWYVVSYCPSLILSTLYSVGAILFRYRYSIEVKHQYRINYSKVLLQEQEHVNMNMSNGGNLRGRSILTTVTTKWLHWFLLSVWKRRLYASTVRHVHVSKHVDTA